MQEFIVIDTAEVLSEAQVRARFKSQTSLPAVLGAATQEFLGIAAITPSPKPAREADQALEPDEVTQDALGNYIRQWRVVSRYASEEERAAAEQAAAAARFEAVKSEVLVRTAERLDAFAGTRNYSSMLSLCTYATSTNARFQAEAQYGVSARDATYARLYELLEEVTTGVRPAPTCFEDIEQELPALEWPAN